MASKFQRMWMEEKAQRENYERVAALAGDRKIVMAAMRVINRNSLTQEFVDELMKPQE
jgi:hypothetical protein